MCSASIGDVTNRRIHHPTPVTAHAHLPNTPSVGSTTKPWQFINHRSFVRKLSNSQRTVCHTHSRLVGILVAHNWLPDNNKKSEPTDPTETHCSDYRTTVSSLCMFTTGHSRGRFTPWTECTAYRSLISSFEFNDFGRGRHQNGKRESIPQLLTIYGDLNAGMTSSDLDPWFQHE